jgi:hypothetical protein
LPSEAIIADAIKYAIRAGEFLHAQGMNSFYAGRLEAMIGYSVVDLGEVNVALCRYRDSAPGCVGAKENPHDFEAMAGGFGWTVAHECARYGTLPKNFDKWSLRETAQGQTVAHIFAQHSDDPFPSDFDQWDMVNNDGWSVAHFAAAHGKLPKDFDQWNLIHPGGKTVRNIADEYERNHKKSPKMGM